MPAPGASGPGSSAPQSAADTGLWLRRYHPAPAAGTVLVCFPHAGGSAGYFHPLSAALSPDVEVLAVQYPGRQDRRTEPFAADLPSLADAIADVLAAVPDGRPFAFLGHSMGAILAFEVAARFRQAGRTGPERLFASGRRAPSTARDERVHLGADAALVAEMRRLAGTDARLLEDPDVLAMILPATRADYRLIETYRWRPGPPLDCPISVLIGDDDPKATVDEARAWAKHTGRGCSLHVFPGGHFYLAEHAAAVVGLVRAELAPTR